jgi:hypothetical protein
MMRRRPPPPPPHRGPYAGGGGGGTCSAAARWTAAMLAVSSASFWLGMHWHHDTLPQQQQQRAEWQRVAPATARLVEERLSVSPPPPPPPPRPELARAAAVDTPAEWGGVFLAPPVDEQDDFSAVAAAAAAASLLPPPPAPVAASSGAALIASLPRGTPVFVTFSTGHMAPFAFNWVAHARALGLTPLLVGALDDEMAVQAAAQGVPAVRLDGSAVLAASSGARYFGTGNPAFKRMGGVKTAFVWELLSAGLHPVLSDADVVWLRDPRPYFDNASLAQADILVSTDCIEIANDEAGCAQALAIAHSCYGASCIAR